MKSDLNQQIKDIQDRNARVEADKAWETSWTRKLLITILTYFFIAFFMWAAGFDYPLIGAMVPSIGYLLSTSTLNFFKRRWINKRFQQKRKVNPKGIVSVGSALFVLMSYPFASSIYIQHQSAPQIYKEIEAIPNSDTALVLGAAIWGNQPSGVLKDRLLAGIRLYKNNKVKKIIMSGTADEVKVMKQFAINNGVPENNIQNDPIGFNTSASVRHLNSKETVIIVTQKYHLYRALFMAKQLEIQATGYIADVGIYPQIFEFKRREIWAASKAMMEFMLLKT